MTRGNNPYNCSRPGNLFVGYTEARTRMLRGLSNGKSFAVMGGRRCGKTSFLLKLEEDLRQAENHDMTPSVFDIQSLVPRTSGDFFSAIYTMAIEGTHAKPRKISNYQDFLTGLDHARNLIEKRYGPSWVRVMLIDELDSSATKLPDSECFQNLRNLLMASRYSRNFRVVATGVSYLSDLITDQSSPLNNLDPEYLSILPLNESRRLAEVGFATVLPESSESILFAASGRHPYLLQGILEYLWENGEGINENTIRSAGRRFARDRAGTFRRWLHDFRPDGCAVYKILSQESVTMRELRAKIPKTFSVDEGLAALSYHGVVDESAPDMPRIGSTIFRDWFQENHQSITNIPADLTENKNLKSVPAVPHRSATAGIDSSLEIAHVLFMDLVSYSTMPMDEQRRLLAGLQELVRNTREFTTAHAEDQLIRLPTGDGMALVFFGSPEAPVRCALEIAETLLAHSQIRLRMGIHSGPVYRIEDINTNLNVAGGGINMAQRVMDCGDAGHILISSSVADVLVQLSEWKGLVRDLGEAVVKHGVKLRVFNVYNDTVGNNEIPQKLKREVNSPMSTRAFGSPKQPTNLQAKPKFAAMLGLVPGIGAVYNGQYVKGLIHAVIFTAGLVIALKVAQHYFLDVLLAALLCFYLYMPVEAYKTAKAHSRTE